MTRKAYLLIKIVSAAGLVAFLSSCEGTTETFQNTSNASTEFTSSTSPGDKDKSDAQLVNAYAAANFDRLREDMARGGGEHLAAFSHLLRIKEDHQSDFFQLTREKYGVLFSSDSTDAKEMVARLDTELKAYPEWRE